MAVSKIKNVATEVYTYSKEDTYFKLEFTEQRYGNVVSLYIVITPKQNMTVSDTHDMGVVSDMHYPPTVGVQAALPLTVSTSDRTPQSNIIVNTNKGVQIWGALTSGRAGSVVLTYVVA